MDLHFTFIFLSLRPRASSSSSQSERSTSPLVMNNTQSFDIMPRVAIPADEEGKSIIEYYKYKNYLIYFFSFFAAVKH